MTKIVQWNCKGLRARHQEVTEEDMRDLLEQFPAPKILLETSTHTTCCREVEVKKEHKKENA